MKFLLIFLDVIVACGSPCFLSVFSIRNAYGVLSGEITRCLGFVLKYARGRGAGRPVPRLSGLGCCDLLGGPGRADLRPDLFLPPCCVLHGVRHTR